MLLQFSILKRAFRFALHERKLWVYALFSGAIISTGMSTALMQLFGVDPSQGIAHRLFDTETGVFGQAGTLWAQAQETGVGASITLIIIGLITLAITCVMLWYMVVSTNALLLAATSPGRTEALSKCAAARFWPSLSIAAIDKLLAMLVLVAWSVAITTVALSTTMRSTILGVSVFLICFLALTVVHCIAMIALCTTTIDNQPIGAALREAWSLLRTRTIIVVETSLLLSIVQLLGILAWIVGMSLAIAPFFLLALISIAVHVQFLYFIAIILGIIASFTATLTIAALTTACIGGTWAQLYLHLTTPGATHETWLARSRS
ncbi:MAG: hypothetical protein ABIG71_02795 [Candidatus Uhrbacteria bacterium]